MLPQFVSHVNPVRFTQNDVGETLLHVACDRGNMTIVSQLLANGAEVDPKEDVDGMTPFMYAVMNDHWDVAKLLLRTGADIDAKDNYGTGALDDVSEDTAAELRQLAK